MNEYQKVAIFFPLAVAAYAYYVYRGVRYDKTHGDGKFHELLLVSGTIIFALFAALSIAGIWLFCVFKSFDAVTP